MISGISGPVCITPTSPRNSTKIQNQTLPYYVLQNQTPIDTTLKAFQICIVLGHKTQLLFTLVCCNSILWENLNERLFAPVLFCSSFSEIMHFAVYAVLYVLHFDRHPTYPILSTLHCYMICIRGPNLHATLLHCMICIRAQSAGQIRQGGKIGEMMKR